MDEKLSIKDATRSFREKLKSGLESANTVFGKIGAVLKAVGTFLFCLRKPVLTVPVVYEALRIARVGLEYLPEQVRIELLPEEIFLDLTSAGTYALELTKNTVIYGSLMITGVCLLMMWCSRKTIYPWLISLFSLILPIAVLLANIYPM